MKKQIFIMFVLSAILFTNSANAIQSSPVVKIENYQAKLTKNKSRETIKKWKKEEKVKRQKTRSNQKENGKTKSKGSGGKDVLIVIGSIVVGAGLAAILFLSAITSVFDGINTESKIRTGGGLGG